MPKRLFSTKPVGELHEADTSNELHRTLDARALVLLGIGAIIGTGIFVLTGTAAANHAGPALVVSPHARLIVVVLSNRVYPRRRPPPFEHHAVTAAIIDAALAKRTT